MMIEPEIHESSNSKPEMFNFQSKNKKARLDFCFQGCFPFLTDQTIFGENVEGGCGEANEGRHKGVSVFARFPDDAPESFVRAWSNVRSNTTGNHQQHHTTTTPLLKTLPK